MKKKLLTFLLYIALVFLVISLVSARVSGTSEYIDNIVSRQTITNPLVTSGDTVNISIEFSTPNERLTGAIKVNDTPPGWKLSPVWITGDVSGNNDDPSTGNYYLSRTGSGGMTGIWSEATRSVAWLTGTSTKTVYHFNYYVTVPADTPPGQYTIKGYVLSSPPAGGVQSASISGDTTITISSGSQPTVTPQSGSTTGTMGSTESLSEVYQISGTPPPNQTTDNPLTGVTTVPRTVVSTIQSPATQSGSPAQDPRGTNASRILAAPENESQVPLTTSNSPSPTTTQHAALPIVLPLISCIVSVVIISLKKRTE